MKPARLPPPVETILIYAAYGWADLNGFQAASGRPRLPERAVWLPLFHAIAASKNGFGTLKRYAERGCAAWRVPASIAACLEDAFADSRFPALLQAGFDDLAATTSPPLHLAARPKSTVPPAPSSRAPTAPPPNLAARIGPRRKPAGPSPG